MNENYYIYKLARQSEKTSYHFYDVESFKATSDSVSENAIYYGLTQDPQSRLSKHRPKKGNDVSLIVVAEFNNPWEALEHEAKLVATHYRKYKSQPELQGMANTGHRGA
tara:strand:- start:897 stop:1223 length:327 start_codon:yes stop_codon:yes gene_type:complete